jgi:hypothetical protein
MVTALILLAIALIICLAFMGITTWMYFNLEKDFEKQKEALKGFSTMFELYSADMTNQNEKAKALLEETKKLVKDSDQQYKKANEAADFAMQTVQECRKMLRLEKTGGQRILYVNGKPAEIRRIDDKDTSNTDMTSMEDFKFEEKEESEDEPRS